MDSVSIELPPVNAKLNAHNKGHWRTKLNAVRDLRTLSFALIRQQTVEQWPAAEIHYQFFFKDKRRRDEANAIQSQKAAIDGVVDAGLIPDDDWQHLRTGSVKCEVDRKNPRVVLTFNRLESVSE